MERRAFLGASSTALLAGCGDQPEEKDGEQQDIEDTPDKDTGIGEQEPETEVEGGAEIVIENEQWINDRSAVEFYVGNNGTTPSGSISITLDWYDEAGNYIGDDTVSLWSLRDGYTWLAAVEPTTRFEVDSYEISSEFTPGRQSGSDQVEVIEYGHFEENGEAITGLIENQRNEPARIDVTVGVYDGGWISDVGSTSAPNVPAGDTWRFYLPLSRIDHTASGLGDDIDLVVYSS